MDNRQNDAKSSNRLNILSLVVVLVFCLLLESIEIVQFCYTRCTQKFNKLGGHTAASGVSTTRSTMIDFNELKNYLERGDENFDAMHGLKVLAPYRIP